MCRPEQELNCEVGDTDGLNQGKLGVVHRLSVHILDGITLLWCSLLQAY